MTGHPPIRRLAAWGVHLYTALGLPLALLVALALHRGDARLAFLAMCAATFVDSTDGVLARLVRVKEVLPGVDGRRLDDLVDFLHFAFLPALALPALDLLPPGLGWLAAVPLVASGYGFSQADAKTDDSFVGFPSYWNVVVLYLYVLGTPAWANLAVVLVLSVLVFVPIHYLYPSRTRMLLRVTVIGGVAWAPLVIAISAAPDAAWARPVALVSLAYPTYYLVVSLVHDRRVRRGQARSRSRC